MYLLDSNICIYYLNQRYESIQQRFESIASQDIYLCSIVKAELWFGAQKSDRREKVLHSLEILFAQFPSISFDDSAAWHASQIWADLKGKGTPIGPYDMQIAAIALAHDLSVVTNNVREFARVDRLRVENWLA